MSRAQLPAYSHHAAESYPLPDNILLPLPGTDDGIIELHNSNVDETWDPNQDLHFVEALWRHAVADEGATVHPGGFIRFSDTDGFMRRCPPNLYQPKGQTKTTPFESLRHQLGEYGFSKGGKSKRDRKKKEPTYFHKLFVAGNRNPMFSGTKSEWKAAKSIPPIASGVLQLSTQGEPTDLTHSEEDVEVLEDYGALHWQAQAARLNTEKSDMQRRMDAMQAELEAVHERLNRLESKTDSVDQRCQDRIKQHADEQKGLWNSFWDSIAQGVSTLFMPDIFQRSATFDPGARISPVANVSPAAPVQNTSSRHSSYAKLVGNGIHYDGMDVDVQPGVFKKVPGSVDVVAGPSKPSPPGGEYAYTHQIHGLNVVPYA